MPEEEKGFVIKDKDAGQNKAGAAPASSEETTLPVLDFSTFVMSLNASALVHLGLIDDPVAGKRVKNLPLGKQTVDLLGMLQEKTRGNLTADEEKLLQGILYDLKIAYVRQKKQG